MPSRAVDFDYREQIGSAYAVLSRLFGKVQTQAGLRLEDAATTLFLPTAPASQQRVDNTYASAFPSGVVSYAFTPMRQLKLSYSRRISRPNAYQLDPVLQKQDARNYFVGNPTLAPVPTLSELAYQATAWGTIQVNPYLRNTAHAVRYIERSIQPGSRLKHVRKRRGPVQAGVDVNVTFRGGPLTLFTGASAYSTAATRRTCPATSTHAFVWSPRMKCELEADVHARRAGIRELSLRSSRRSMAIRTRSPCS